MAQRRRAGRGGSDRPWTSCPKATSKRTQSSTSAPAERVTLEPARLAEARTLWRLRARLVAALDREVRGRFLRSADLAALEHARREYEVKFRRELALADLAYFGAEVDDGANFIVTGEHFQTMGEAEYWRRRDRLLSEMRPQRFGLKRKKPAQSPSDLVVRQMGKRERALRRLASLVRSYQEQETEALWNGKTLPFPKLQAMADAIEKLRGTEYVTKLVFLLQGIEHAQEAEAEIKERQRAIQRPGEYVAAHGAKLGRAMTAAERERVRGMLREELRQRERQHEAFGGWVSRLVSTFRVVWPDSSELSAYELGELKRNVKGGDKWDKLVKFHERLLKDPTKAESPAANSLRKNVKQSSWMGSGRRR